MVRAVRQEAARRCVARSTAAPLHHDPYHRPIAAQPAATITAHTTGRYGTSILAAPGRASQIVVRSTRLHRASSPHRISSWTDSLPHSAPHTGYPPRHPPMPEKGQRVPPWITLHLRGGATSIRQCQRHPVQPNHLPAGKPIYPRRPGSFTRHRALHGSAPVSKSGSISMSVEANRLVATQRDSCVAHHATRK
jgi:hypothetical protein